MIEIVEDPYSCVSSDNFSTGALPAIESCISIIPLFAINGGTIDSTYDIW